MSEWIVIVKKLAWKNFYFEFCNALLSPLREVQVLAWGYLLFESRVGTWGRGALVAQGLAGGGGTGPAGRPRLPFPIGSLGLPIVGPYTHTIFTRYYYFTTDNIPFGQKTHRTSRIHHEAVSLCCKIALSSMELDQGGCRCSNSHLRTDDRRLASAA